MNRIDILQESYEKFGAFVYLVYEGREVTNVDCDSISSQMARAMMELGVGKGDRVVVTMPNRPEVVFAYHAIAKAGAVAVPVMPLLQTQEIRFIAMDCAPKLVVTSDMLLGKVQEAVGELPQKPIVVSVDADANAGEAGALNRIAASQPDLAPNVQVDANDPGVILYTSGTTGRPKGVVLTHANLYSNAQSAAQLAIEYAGSEGNWVGLVILPLSHAFGFTMMNSTAMAGARDILLPYFDPVLVFSTIEKYKVTHFSGVPAMFHAMLTHADADQYDLSSLSQCISGSAPLSAAVKAQFEQKFGCTIYEGYGLSEAAPVVTAPRKGFPVKPGSVGLPIPGVEVKVVDERGNALAAGEVGELTVKGPNVTQGYLNLPEETQKVIQDGWLYTGDMAKIDDEGYVYIVERKKDVIIRGGFNVYPRDLEELLATHPAVAEVSVVGTPSEAMGEEVVAFVVKRRGVDVTEADLISFCQDRLAKYKTPRYLKFVGYLPKTMIGKTDKKVLREWAREASSSS